MSNMTNREIQKARQSMCSGSGLYVPRARWGERTTCPRCERRVRVNKGSLLGTHYKPESPTCRCGHSRDQHGPVQTLCIHWDGCDCRAFEAVI